MSCRQATLAPDHSSISCSCGNVAVSSHLYRSYLVFTWAPPGDAHHGGYIGAALLVRSLQTLTVVRNTAGMNRASLVLSCQVANEDKLQ